MNKRKILRLLDAEFETMERNGNVTKEYIEEYEMKVENLEKIPASLLEKAISFNLRKQEVTLKNGSIINTAQINETLEERIKELEKNVNILMESRRIGMIRTGTWTDPNL